MFEHILVPTDFNEPAEHALDVAIELAKKFDARVSILHAYQLFVPMPYLEITSFPFEEIAASAAKKLEAVVTKTKQRYPNCEALLRPGLPTEETIAAVEGSGIDLIVMGTHGRRGVSRVVMGSVAERVVRTSPVPVLTIGERRGRK